VASRVLPNVSSSAIESMHGPVVVETRVLVDRTGAVSKPNILRKGRGIISHASRSEPQSRGSLRRHRHMGIPKPSVWTLRFYFSRGKMEVSATEEER